MSSLARDHKRDVSGLGIALRLLVIVTVVIVEAARTLPAVGARLLVNRANAKRRWYQGLVRVIQTLGPTFVKFGQIAGTRRDALPAGLCDELGTLHDRVAPMPWSMAERVLREAQRRQPALVIQEIDQVPVGSGSIACVYRARLADGRQVAVKLKRPDIDRRMRTDLALLRGLVRLAERTPAMRGMPVADLVGYVSEAILQQLDFAQEARNLAILREAVAAFPEVRVPVLYDELSGPDCLVFEFIDGLDVSTPETLSAECRARLGAAVLAAAHQMIFVRGFVHCDLHPGNLYLTKDEQVVILDAGYCVQLPARVRDLIGEFFGRLARGDGKRCGEIILESAVVLGTPEEQQAFVDDVAALVARSAGPGKTFDMPTFGNEIFALQQRYHLYAASDFAFPLMSLLVLEGTVRSLSPTVDFQQVGTAGPLPRRGAVG